MHGRKNPYHHESIGALIIQNDKYIRTEIINNYIYIDKENNVINVRFRQLYDAKGIDGVITSILSDIVAIITGNTENVSEVFPNRLSLMVQMLHSELDADNIDYLLRDATFSGTTYGILDMGLLIQSLSTQSSEFNISCGQDYENGEGKEPHFRKVSHYILGVKPKGVGCVEQFMLNRYYAYYQVIHHKYTAVLGAMLRAAISWFLSDPNSQYTFRDIRRIAIATASDQRYLSFTDNYIINFINQYPLNEYSCPKIIKSIIGRLRKYLAFNMNVEDEEVCVGLTESKIKETLMSKNLYLELTVLEEEIRAYNAAASKLASVKEALCIRKFAYQFEHRKLTKQIPETKFDELLDAVGIDKDNETREMHYIDRLLNCVALITDSTASQHPKLLVDSERSILKDIYSLQYFILRKYSITE